MNRANPVLAVLFVIGFWSSSPFAFADEITYDLNNYPALQNGWTLTGSITTDGTIGQIEPGDIVSWQYTVSNGVTSYSSSTETGGYSQVDSNVIATSTQILLYSPVGLTYNQLYLIGSFSAPSSFLVYDRDDSGPSPEQDLYRQDVPHVGLTWNDYSEDSANLSVAVRNWTIVAASTDPP